MQVTNFSFTDPDLIGYALNPRIPAVDIRFNDGLSNYKDNAFHLSFRELKDAREGGIGYEKTNLRDGDILRIASHPNELNIYFTAKLKNSWSCVFLKWNEVDFLLSRLASLDVASRPVTSVSQGVEYLKDAVTCHREEALKYFSERNYKLAEATNELAEAIQKALNEHEAKQNS